MLGHNILTVVRESNTREMMQVAVRSAIECGDPRVGQYVDRGRHGKRPIELCGGRMPLLACFFMVAHMSQLRLRRTCLWSNSHRSRMLSGELQRRVVITTSRRDGHAEDAAKSWNAEEPGKRGADVNCLSGFRKPERVSSDSIKPASKQEVGGAERHLQAYGVLSAESTSARLIMRSLIRRGHHPVSSTENS